VPLWWTSVFWQVLKKVLDNFHQQIITKY